MLLLVAFPQVIAERVARQDKTQSQDCQDGWDAVSSVLPAPALRSFGFRWMQLSRLLGRWNELLTCLVLAVLLGLDWMCSAVSCNEQCAVCAMRAGGWATRPRQTLKSDRHRERAMMRWGQATGSKMTTCCGYGCLDEATAHGPRPSSAAWRAHSSTFWMLDRGQHLLAGQV